MQAPDEDFIIARTSVTALRDGTRVKIRPVVPTDKQRFLDGFGRLSPASRYRRFLAPVDELTSDMLRYFTEVDYRDHFAYVALLADRSDEPGIGVARYVRIPDDPEVAEAAVTVVDDYQGRGVGMLLLKALGAVALENDIKRFRGYALESNRPLREILDAMKASTTYDSPGILRVEIDLPAQAEDMRGRRPGSC